MYVLYMFLDITTGKLKNDMTFVGIHHFPGAVFHSVRELVLDSV